MNTFPRTKGEEESLSCSSFALLLRSDEPGRVGQSYGEPAACVNHSFCPDYLFFRYQRKCLIDHGELMPPACPKVDGSSELCRLSADSWCRPTGGSTSCPRRGMR